MRTSHAKATGLLTGELTVENGLPEELAQGLFAKPGTYEALIRFAQGPGEILDDKISTHRRVGLKILGVEDERIPESRESATQDWLLAPGPAFIEARHRYFDERLSFQPAHSLAAHRPLGGINRACLAVYDHMQDQRQRNNGVQPVEPKSTSEVAA